MTNYSSCIYTMKSRSTVIARPTSPHRRRNKVLTRKLKHKGVRAVPELQEELREQFEKGQVRRG